MVNTGLLENNYVVHFDVKQVDPTPAKPHGISYNLVLLYKDRDRVLGYDNRDPFREPGTKGKFRCRRTVWDHKHQRGWVFAYDFTNALQLMDDFWKDAKPYFEEDIKDIK